MTSVSYSADVHVQADVYPSMLLIQGHQNGSPEVRDNLFLNWMWKKWESLPSAAATKLSILWSSCNIYYHVGEVLKFKWSR